MAAAMLVWLSRRSRLMARLRSDAITRGAFPALSWLKLLGRRLGQHAGLHVPDSRERRLRTHR